MAANSASNSALLNFVDETDDEIVTSQQEATNTDTFIGVESDTEKLIGGTESFDGSGKKESPFSFAYYTKLFDVDTDEIVARLMWAVFPRPSTSSFASQTIRAKPDLYGPFWICVTLVFSIAISGNVASYFQYNISPEETTKHWHYDFHKVSVSAAIVFLYSTLVPSGVFAALWSGTPNEVPVKPSLTELICIFGYSLAPFVPMSVLWLIQISLLQWVFVLVSFVLSGGVLALAVWPIVQEFSGAKTKGYAIIAVILVLQLLLATGFMLCFFHASGSSTTPIVNTTVEVKHEQKFSSQGASHEEKRETVNEIPLEMIKAPSTKSPTEPTAKQKEKIVKLDHIKVVANVSSEHQNE